MSASCCLWNSEVRGLTQYFFPTGWLARRSLISGNLNPWLSMRTTQRVWLGQENCYEHSIYTSHTIEHGLLHRAADSSWKDAPNRGMVRESSSGLSEGDSRGLGLWRGGHVHGHWKCSLMGFVHVRVSGIYFDYLWLIFTCYTWMADQHIRYSSNIRVTDHLTFSRHAGLDRGSHQAPACF